MPARTFQVTNGHTRMLKRQEAREANAREEQKLLDRASERRQKLTMDDRVGAAVRKLTGSSVAQAVGLIEGLADVERDPYLIAEEISQNRPGVLRAFPKPRKASRIAYFGTDLEPDKTPKPSKPRSAPAVEKREGTE